MSLVQQQTTMGLYLRDPEHNAPPTEMDPARAQVYRDLCSPICLHWLSGTFPVLVKDLGDEHRRSLVRIFQDYRACTPKFGEIAQEFVEFLASIELRRWSMGRGRCSWWSWRITSRKWRCNSPTPSLWQLVMRCCC